MNAAESVLNSTKSHRVVLAAIMAIALGLPAAMGGARASAATLLPDGPEPFGDGARVPAADKDALASPSQAAPRSARDSSTVAAEIRQIGACCSPDGSCTETEPANCIPPDVHMGDDTWCTPNCCPQPPTGADFACEWWECFSLSLGDWTGVGCDGPGDPGEDCAPFPEEDCLHRSPGPDNFQMTIPGHYECHDQLHIPTGFLCSEDADCIPFDPFWVCAFAAGASVEYAFAGDSSAASVGLADGDTCTIDEDDLGWYEGFTVINDTGDPANDCALVTVDLCCNEPYVWPIWLPLTTHCPDCEWVFPDEGAFGFGCDGGNGAAHCCWDINHSASYTVRPDTYSWQINATGTCDTGAVIPCQTDDDCPGVPCVPHAGPYTGHFTIDACPTAACCVPFECLVTNKLHCEDTLGGTWLGDVAEPHDHCAFAPCTQGSCCVAPGVCDDQPPCNTQDGREGVCDGEFVSGVTCEDNPCPACIIGSEEFCKEEGGSARIIMSDRNLNVRIADDFRPAGDTIAQLCWSPAFLGPDDECSAPGMTPPDDWLVSIYPDDGSGLPDNGDPVAVDLPVTVLGKTHRGANSRVWGYYGSIDPVTVVPAECYWLEITGYGDRNCRTYLTTAGEGNQHCMRDFANYGSYENLDARAEDYLFCIDSGLDGSIDCGPRYGACCTCPGICTDAMTQEACRADLGGWRLSESCGPETCPGVPPNDDCENATPIGGLLAGDVRLPLNNICATDDGPVLGCGSGDLHFDVWYRYQAQDYGVLTVSTCDLAFFDTILNFYDGTGGVTAACADVTGPTGHLYELNDCNLPGGDCCGDDTCNITAGPSELSMEVIPGREILIRLGGWYDMGTGTGDGQGWGEINFSLAYSPPDCNENGIHDSCDPDCGAPGGPCDIPGCGQSEDCTGNLIPDECEPDCQPAGMPGNGTADSCDILNAISLDTNENGIPDECDAGACCYILYDYYMCVETPEWDCLATWAGTFLGLDTTCPTEGVSSATHNGVAVVHITDPAQTCGEGRGRSDCIPGDPIDPWKTAIDAIMCHQFGIGPESPPIPADFFGPGSDPFDGQVCLEGEPLGATPFGEFGEADTLIRRPWDPFDRCALPLGVPVPVMAEVVALSLKSTAPITVTEPSSISMKYIAGVGTNKSSTQRASR